MRCTHNHEGTHRVRQVDRVALCVSDNEGAAALPHFRFGVELNDHRAALRLSAVCQQTIGFSGDDVGGGGVRERELVAWEEVVFVLAREASWLRELVVSERTAGAGD